MISHPAAESQWNRPMSCRRESSLKKNENRVHLGTNYIPGHNAVICGRGKACTSSPGNKKLRAYIDLFAKSYGSATNKEQKSKIVSAIISLIEEPEGGAFVKFEESTWWKVDEAYAREKIGNLFRDVLHTKYRSSSKAKQKKRKQETVSRSVGFNNEIQSIVTKISLGQSHSSSCSSSVKAMCPTNNSKSHCHWNMNVGSNHGRFVPSWIGFPSLPSMVFGIGNGCNSAISPTSHPPLERRNMLFNYCNEALKITCNDPVHMSQPGLHQTPRNMSIFCSSRSIQTASDMAASHITMFPSTVSCKDVVPLAKPDMSERSFKAYKVSLKVSEEWDRKEKNDDNDDEVSIATFAGDDDIFRDFLVENKEELSRVF
ncbi:hypothetical protein IV203_028472 [Nitzschia inconspicua]|uniref:DUF6824 domain-containing protein n=1 Tax=Nitzschia inconspicua TaxID=303405 RepID=A0A9K3PZF1_9STRA|nr:hypothetical protein IV203_028472 [Nitzschia inconspicua]